jgi:8-oxo-dGTP pyrophosphatase MutT (NUDIX family)
MRAMSEPPPRPRPVLARLAASPLPHLLFRVHGTWLRLRRPVTLGARMAVRDADGAFLLVRHTYRPGWFLPGGGVDKWESFESCAIRETREEAGIAVTAMGGLFGLYSHFTAERCDHVALYVADAWERCGDPVALEIAEARFFAPGALPPDASPSVRRRVDEILGIRPRIAEW